MDAEAAYLQGAWEKAAVLLERARADAARAGKHDPLLRLLALRLALCGKGKRGTILPPSALPCCKKHDGVQVHLLETSPLISTLCRAGRSRP